MNSVAFKEITANGLWPAPRLAGGVEGSARHPPDESEIEVCTAWLRKFADPTPRIRRKHTSYGLKHAVERWTAREQGTRGYVSNGAFIEAARRLGYRIEPTSPGSPNAFFNIELDALGLK